MPKKLTDLGVGRTKPPASGRVEIWDSEVRGFGVRVSENGIKSWQLLYRFEGKQRRKTLGRFPVIALSEAREMARATLNTAARGIDPEEAEADAAAERAAARATTFGAVSMAFIDQYARPKIRGWAKMEAYFRRDLADWSDKPIASITAREARAVIAAKAATSPFAANALLSHCRTMCSWAIQQELLAVSPFTGIKQPISDKEGERERVLSEDEIRLVWPAFEALDMPFGKIFQLLLITGQRRDEVAGLRWDEVDLSTQTWTIPRERTKADREHQVPLAPLAIEIITSIPRTASPLVFPAQGFDDRHVSGFSQAKRRVDELSKVTDWRIHDLRRTCGTGMASAGIAVSTISRVLNHAEGGVTKIYNRYSYGNEKRHALDTWARKLDGIIRPAPANVVEMRAAQ